MRMTYCKMKDLNQLILEIRQEFNDKGIKDCDVPRIQKLMETYVSNPKDWEKFAFFDQDKYTRNLVDDGNGKYNLLLLCWGAGQKSPIHDHANSHCILKVLQGQLTESLYNWPKEETQMALTQEKAYEVNEVNYMHDGLGLHRIANNSGQPAVSLHLYSPPILSCKSFVEDSGQARQLGKCCLYSKNGKRCTNSNADLCKSATSLH